MTRSGKTPDKTVYTVRRPLLPLAFAKNAVDKSTEYPSTSSTSTASPLAQMLFRGALFLTLGLVLLPISLIVRMLFGRWTVEASVGTTSRRWRARTRAAAGAGVEAIAAALGRGESLDQQFPGLTPLA